MKAITDNIVLGHRSFVGGNTDSVYYYYNYTILSNKMEVFLQSYLLFYSGSIVVFGRFLSLTIRKWSTQNHNYTLF